MVEEGCESSTRRGAQRAAQVQQHLQLWGRTLERSQTSPEFIGRGAPAGQTCVCPAGAKK